MKENIFISHANPVNNDQARWLGMQLMTLGYNVWCDVFNLKGGDKFWQEIEHEIRNNTCKFLYLLTGDSNQNDGCHKELSVAEAVEKGITDKRFIIALHFDKELSYDDININLKQRIDVNFKSDWRKGLVDLLKIFSENPIVPKSTTPDFEYLNNYWNSIFLNDRKPIVRTETYSSNWFPFNEMPEHIYFHNFDKSIPEDFDMTSLLHPWTSYKKKYCVSFDNHQGFQTQIPTLSSYDSRKTTIFNVKEILQGNFGNQFISNKTLRNLINYLIKDGFIKTLKRKGLLSHEMSKTIAFCFLNDVNDSSKFSFGQLVGKIKSNTWHFAFSGFPDLINNVFVIKSHILGSNNEGMLLLSDRTQQSIRRKQGRSWWNKHWSHKLFSTMATLSDDDGFFRIEVGDDKFIKVSGQSLAFQSEISYVDPDEAKEALDDYGEDVDDIETIEAVPIINE